MRSDATPRDQLSEVVRVLPTHGLILLGLLRCTRLLFGSIFLSFSVSVGPVSVCLLDFVVTLNGRSHDFVDAQLPNLHLHSELPDSAVFPEVHQAVVVD